MRTVSLAVRRLVSVRIAAGDRRHVVEPAEPAGQLADRGQPLCQSLAGRGDPGAADGRRHVVAEGSGEGPFVAGPGIRLAVIQDEEAERLVAVDQRDVADALDADVPVDTAEGRDRRPHVAIQDADALAAQGVHAGRPGVAGQAADGRDDRGGQAALGGEGQRRRVSRVVHPQASPVHAEQGEGLVDDVLEEGCDVASTAQAGRDPTQRVGTRRTRRGVATRRRPGRAGGGLAAGGRRALAGRGHRGLGAPRAGHPGTGGRRAR